MILTLLFITYIVCAIAGAVVSADPTVYLAKSNVTYQGASRSDVEHFLNIKYAEDTSGSRRFAPPVEYKPPEGSRIVATAPGPACPQSEAALPPFFDATPDISEDCLHLRISRPAGTAADAKLPVVVWLHGGGVVKGSAYDPHFDPDELIKLSVELGKPVIYVALNYRLTIFGFARLPILKEQKSLNVGMRDQRAGFQWVRDNIEAFGGDPRRITTYGLSAGGTFSTLQTMAYGGERGVPFDQIWAMSGPPGNALNSTSDVYELHTRAVAETLHCSEGSDEDILECLRHVPVAELTRVAMEYSVHNHPPHGIHTFIPSVDGDFLPDRYSALFKSGRFVKDIPMVLGWVHDDAGPNAVPASRFQKEEDMKDAFTPFIHSFTDDDYRHLFALYPASDFEEEFNNYESRRKDSEPVAPIHFFRASRMLRDILFSCSSISFGYEMWRRSKELHPSFAGVHVYDFNQSMLAPMLASAGMPYLGPCHGSDTNYIFNGVFPEGEVSEDDQKLSRSMTGSFINFAYTGTPNFAEDDGFASWPDSFTGLQEGDNPHFPSSLNLQVIGGPFGTGPGSLEVEHIETGFAVLDNGIRDVEFGEMGSPESQERQRLVRREKLLERCAFIDSLSEKLGV